MRAHEKVEAHADTVDRKVESTGALVLSDDGVRVEEPMAEVYREPEVNLLNGLTDYLDRLAAENNEYSQITDWPQFIQEIRPAAAAVLVAEFGAHALHAYNPVAYADVRARVIDPVERLARSSVPARIHVARQVYDQIRGRLADLKKRYREAKLGKHVGKALRCKNELQKVIVEKVHEESGLRDRRHHICRIPELSVEPESTSLSAERERLREYHEARAESVEIVLRLEEILHSRKSLRDDCDLKLDRLAQFVALHRRAYTVADRAEQFVACAQRLQSSFRRLIWFCCFYEVMIVYIWHCFLNF
eukprot:400569_1